MKSNEKTQSQLYDLSHKLSFPDNDREKPLFTAESDFELTSSPQLASSGSEQKKWNILIVDDEPDIHTVIRLALSDFSYQNQTLEFTDAYSASQAKEILQTNKQFALILLDVVMENHTAGLNLVRYIREEIDNKFIRVVLWTGQPGHAPEKEVIAQYEINDYRTKTELTADKLFTVVLSALRNYTSLLEIESFRQHLEEKVQSRTQELELQKQVLLRQSIDLQKALNIKDHFLRIISHDLKNPLAAILSISNTLIHNPEGEREETRDGLNHIKLSADHLLKLLQNLLDWLKAQRESLNFQPENTTLYPLLCDTVGLYRTAADYKKIEIICEIDRQTQVIADKNMLATLLRNLISNAIKYSFPNGTITIGIFEHDSEIEIYVRDTGIGISHADIETILNSLQVFSHEGTQKEKGTGIGLFICKQLLEAHHSSLHIISTPNQGSQFSFLLPKTNIKKE